MKTTILRKTGLAVVCAALASGAAFAAAYPDTALVTVTASGVLKYSVTNGVWYGKTTLIPNSGSYDSHATLLACAIDVVGDTIYIGRDDEAVVSGNKILKFDLRGNYLGVFKQLDHRVNTFIHSQDQRYLYATAQSPYNKIYRYDLTDGTEEELVPTTGWTDEKGGAVSGSLTIPRQICWGPNGELVVMSRGPASGGTGNAYAFNAQTGRYIAKLGTVPSAKGGVVYDPVRSLYFLSNSSGNCIGFDTDGAPSSTTIALGSSASNVFSGQSWGNNLYFGCWNSSKIYKCDAAGTVTPAASSVGSVNQLVIYRNLRQSIKAAWDLEDAEGGTAFANTVTPSQSPIQGFRRMRNTVTGASGKGVWFDEASYGIIRDSAGLLPAVGDFSVFLWAGKQGGGPAGEHYLLGNNPSFGETGRCGIIANFSGGASVCVSAEARPWERTAKAELESYLRRLTKSGELTVDGQNGIVFHVGDTVFAKEMGLCSSALADEEWVIKSFGRDVVLNGGGSRGCLYAVSHFLEDQCGVRWWYDGDEDVPEAKLFHLPALDRRGKPRFLYRDIYRQPSNDVATAVHNRVNGNGDGKISVAFGGGCEFGPPYHCHTWDKLVPFKTYGKVHPEWYSLVNGRRQGGPETSGPDAGQLCLTADGLVDFFAEQVEKAIAEGESAARAAGKPAPKLYDISMNDNKNYCECEKCTAVRMKYGHSGEQLLFENEVARRVGAKHPELFFSVLAYYEAEEVPKGGVRAADNVVVKLTNTRANMAAGIFEKSNRFMHDRIAEWRKYAKHLIVWDYLVTYDGETKGYPFASEYYIGERFRYCAENGVIGFLLEQEEPDIGDMYDLKYHVASRFMEDPDSDLKAILDDFYPRYFGAAGAKIRAAREHLDRIRRERGGFVTWFPRSGEFAFIRQEDVDRMVSLWDEAETLVRGDSKRLGRVRRARRGLDRLKADRDRAAKYWKAAEAGVSDGAFVDCPVTKQGYVRHVKGIDLVDDVASSCGKALRIPLSLNAHCRLPFEIGVYSPALQKGLAGKRWEKPLGSDYCWYELGEVDLPESYYVFFTRGWYVQACPPVPELAGRKCRIKARVRITDEAVFLDRTVFIPMDGQPVATVFHSTQGS